MPHVEDTQIPDLTSVNPNDALHAAMDIKAAFADAGFEPRSVSVTFPHRNGGIPDITVVTEAPLDAATARAILTGIGVPDPLPATENGRVYLEGDHPSGAIVRALITGSQP